MEESPKTVVLFDTNLGEFEVTLNHRAAPTTVENFTCLVEQGFYDSLQIFRVVQGFVIQGGDPEGGRTCTGQPLPNEPNPYVSFANAFTIGMARGAEPSSATSQFFITLRDAGFLDDQDFTAFGRVTRGASVVAQIGLVPVGPQPGNGEPSRPIEPVVMRSVSVLRSG